MPMQSSLDFFVQWHLTERCNLRCRHCYQTGAADGEMTLPEILEGLEEIAETAGEWSRLYNLDLPLSFSLTGGEPFLRRDFLDIVGAVRGRGFDVFILSNGILVDQDVAKRLAVLGVKGVQVSFEGPREVHETIRGQGSFEASLAGVKSLLNAGIEVTLNVTISEVNAAFLPAMIDLAAALGVPRLGFSRLVPAGRGLDLLPEMLSRERLREIYERIFSADTRGVTIVSGDPVAGQMRTRAGAAGEGDTPLGGCAAGFSGITILPDGTLLPCRRLPLPVGNIRRDSFREVWASSPILVSLRDRSGYGGRCGTCSRWAACRGCRAIAWASAAAAGNPDHLAEDPQCFLRS